MSRIVTRVLAAIAMLIASGVASAQCVTSCGTERWDVKTGCDAQVGDVALDTPIDTTIADLRTLTPPPDLHHFQGRAADEKNVYVVEATMTLFKSESDKDLHLVLKDGAKTIIAEIPNPSCVANDSPFHDAIVALRPCFSQHFNNAKSKKNLKVRVRVTGVGFFDFLHGQTGVAPNGIELHPILGITFLADDSQCGEAAQ